MRFILGLRSKRNKRILTKELNYIIHTVVFLASFIIFYIFFIFFDIIHVKSLKKKNITYMFKEISKFI